MSFEILSKCYMNSLTRGVPLLLLLSTRSLSSITAGASSRRRRRGSLPNEKTIYNLTDQQVKKYYYLIKMIDHQHLYLINNTTTISSTTCSDRKLFDKINSEWRHKSQSDRIRLKEAFENIIYDMNQHKTIEIITTNDNNNDNDNNNNNNKSFKQGSIILNCDPYVIYSQNNQFIPFNFRFWLSPYLIEHSQINNINLLPLEIPGDQLKNWNNFKIILNNNNNDNINNQVSTPTAAQNQEIRYLIDDNFSWIQFDVKWTGFRYYMVKYYYSCYLIGTIIFFMVSAGVGFFTSYTILLLNNRNKL